MHSKAKGPTKAERLRMAWIKEDGCGPCRKIGIVNLADADHEVVGGKRTGHSRTIPICPWHHRGVPPNGWTASMAEMQLGPTKSRDMRGFYSRFGTFDEQLAEVNERYENRQRPAGY